MAMPSTGQKEVAIYIHDGAFLLATGGTADPNRDTEGPHHKHYHLWCLLPLSRYTGPGTAVAACAVLCVLPTMPI